MLDGVVQKVYKHLTDQPGLHRRYQHIVGNMNRKRILIRTRPGDAGQWREIYVRRVERTG